MYTEGLRTYVNDGNPRVYLFAREFHEVPWVKAASVPVDRRRQVQAFRMFQGVDRTPSEAIGLVGLRCRYESCTQSLGF